MGIEARPSLLAARALFGEGSAAFSAPVFVAGRNTGSLSGASCAELAVHRFPSANEVFLLDWSVIAKFITDWDAGGASYVRARPVLIRMRV